MKLIAVSWATVALLATGLAYAGPKQVDLEKEGYKCEIVSANFIECTNKDGKVYWCTSGVCEAKPRVTRPPVQPSGPIYRPPRTLQ